MATPADTPYIIGVIRNQERLLLQNDEYTRMTAAATATEALHVLVDTPYGAWIAQDTARDVWQALEERLVALQRWLAESLTDQSIVQFMQVRYDALNVASALLDRSVGRQAPGELSGLGSINPAVLHTVIWQETDFDQIPESWERFIREELELLAKAPDTGAFERGLLLRSEQHALALLDTLASTELTRWYADFTRNRLAADHTARREGSAADAAYERDWDNKLIEQLRRYTGDPIGFDPIVAFWLTVELEVKTIRLVLTGKLQGLPAEQITPLRRDLVHQL